jgi:hypothetical protein
MFIDNRQVIIEIRCEVVSWKQRRDLHPVLVVKSITRSTGVACAREPGE